MGKYHVAAPDGREFEIEGDAPPSESDLEQIFGAQPDKPAEPAAGDALDAVFQNSLKTGARIPSDAARSLMDAAVNNAKYPAYQMPEGVGQGVVRRIGESKPVQLLSRPLLDLAPSSESIRSVLTLPFQLAQERAENTPDNQSSPIAEKVMAATPSDKALAVATGATRAVGDMASFFTSPIGIATLGMGALPATAQKGIALAFAAQMASELPDTANELMSELQKPEDQRDYEKISKLATSGAASTILTGIGMKHGMAETPAKAFPSEINLEKQGAPNAETVSSDKAVNAATVEESQTSGKTLSLKYENPKPAVISEFTTAKGSTYQLHEGGTTTRNKSARKEHPGDSGTKERSTKTIYVPTEAANEMLDNMNSLWDEGDWMTWLNKDGQPVGGVVRPRNEAGVKVPVSSAPIPHSTAPKLGLTPIEYWVKSGRTSIHIGNPITGIREKGKVAPSPAADAAQELGFEAKRNDAAGMNTEGMPPEMVAAIREKHGPQIEFTDKRPDSPHPGMTFYMPEDATKEQIVARYQEKVKEFAKSGELSQESTGVTPDFIKGVLANLNEIKLPGVEIKVGGSVARGSKTPRDLDLLFDVGSEPYFANDTHPFWQLVNQLAQDDRIQIWINNHGELSILHPGEGKSGDRMAGLPKKNRSILDDAKPIKDVLAGVNTGALGDVGMGAAKEGEVASSGDSSVTGLAERVRKEREASGHTAPTEQGAGIAPEASVERGRQLLPASNPEQIMSEFEKSGRFSSDDVAVVRAKAEELARATNKSEEKFGTDSNDFRQAFKTESDWAARTKKMQTEWAKSGHAQQGEVDIDTGTFSGLARAFKEDTGRDFTPEQAGTAKKKAGKVKQATAAEDLSKQRLFDQLDKQAGGTRAEQRAFDAANKTVREWAIKRAQLENEARTAKTVREQATAKVQLDAVTRAQDAANKTVREAQIRLAKAENNARIKQAQQANDIRDVQVQAAKRAQDAADNRVRELNAELARAENRKRVATAKKEKDFAEESRRAAQAKLDKAHKEARLAAVQRAKAEVKANIARADTPTYAWKKAKEYIDKGMDDFDEIRNKLATDLGISVKKVTEALGKDKRTKLLADDLWRKQQVARELRTQAKLWLKQASTPGYIRALQSVPKILFSLKVGFHGTVALGTHAPMVAFQPRFWKTYVTNFAKMYHMIVSRAYYENQVQDLIRRRPNYTTARRAGLVNDPFTYEDFNSPDTAKYFGGLAGMGNRGYSVLKILRQDMFDQMWNKLPRTAQMPEIAEAIADGLNHSTGVVKGRAPTGSNLALFAPRLEASRVAWLAVDPVKALASVVNWKNTTAGEKVFAINQIKEKAWVAGTMFGILALNQGFLSAIGSKQKVNFDDPLKSDFLKFKIAGMSFSYGNAMISMARLPVRLYQIRQSSGGKAKNLVYPDESSYTVLGEYVRSQLSPFASLASSLWFKSDWQNRPLPNSNRPVPKRLADQGIKAYTWPEFWSEQFLPIPLEEAAREVWKNGLGMSDEQIGSLRKAMATIAVMGATGGRLVDDAAPHTIHERLSQFNKDKPDADYGALRAALDKDDTAGAKAAYEELRKARKPDVIDNAMRPFNTVRIPGTEYWETHYKPLTGSHKDELKFLQSLDAEGKMLYEKNKAERLEQYKKFQQMLKSW